MKRKNALDQPTLFTQEHPSSPPPPAFIPEAPTLSNSLAKYKGPAWMNASKNPIVSWLKSSTPRVPAYSQLAQDLRRGTTHSDQSSHPPTEGSTKLANQLVKDFANDQRLSREEIGALLGDVQQAARDAAQMLFDMHPSRESTRASDVR
jgi:hypothetical protein